MIKYDNLLKEIDKVKTDIDMLLENHVFLTQTEYQKLKESFVIENTYNTNAIEGNSMTLRETALVLEGVTIDKKPLKEHLELIGHREAFKWIETIIKDDIPLTIRLIKDIHSLVLMGNKLDGGVYRKIPVYLRGSEYKPVEPYLIESKMENLIFEYEQMKKTKHIVEVISIFHLMFESIHPFIDGNGRVGRLLINYELMRNRYFPIDIKYKDVKRYYEAFNIYHESGEKDYSSMVELISSYVLTSLKELFKILLNKMR